MHQEFKVARRRRYMWNYKGCIPGRLSTYDNTNDNATKKGAQIHREFR